MPSRRLCGLGFSGGRCGGAVHAQSPLSVRSHGHAHTLQRRSTTWITVLPSISLAPVCFRIAATLMSRYRRTGDQLVGFPIVVRSVVLSLDHRVPLPLRYLLASLCICRIVFSRLVLLMIPCQQCPACPSCPTCALVSCCAPLSQLGEQNVTTHSTARRLAARKRYDSEGPRHTDHHSWTFPESSEIGIFIPPMTDTQAPSSTMT